MTSGAPRDPARRWQRAIPWAAVVASVFLIVGPLLRPGYVLRYDMDFAPDPPLGRDLLGLGSQLPRAVPSDLVVALLSHLVPGDVVQDAVLVLLLVAGGAGAQRVCGSTVAARVAAGLAYVWTPYVAERLLLGQWAVLVGWAVLPWLVAVARTGSLRRWVLVAGVAALGGAPAMLLTVPAGLAVAGRVAGRGWWRAVAVRLAAAVVLALPWVLPTLLRPGTVGADPQGATVFAPRADTPLGRVGSLLTGGGIWNADTVPPGRDTAVAAVLALVLLGAGAVGLARRRDPATLPLAVVAGVSAALAVLAAWPSGARVLGDLPGGAALRDAQRLVAPLVLAVAVGVGTVVGDVVCAVLPRRGGRVVARSVFLLALLPVAALPSVAWGVSGRLVPVRYPAEVLAARALVDHDPRPGGVFVLPAQAYRAYSWNGGRTSLTVLSRLFDRPTVVVQDLPVLVHGQVVTVRGEDRLASTLANAARTGRLAGVAARAGVRFVAVDGAVPAAALTGLRPLRRTGDVAVYEVRGVDAARARRVFAPYAAPTLPVVLGDVVALALLAGGVLAHPRLLGSRTGNGEQRETD